MGYTTDFTGKFKFNKKLDKDTYDLLVYLSTTRRMARNVDSKYGIEGEFYIGSTDDYGQGHDDNIIDHNRPPKSQPSLWLQWTPSSSGKFLEWDGNEKFYNYVEWLEYLLEKILVPRGYILNGSVKFQGEDYEDCGTIDIENNVVTKNSLLKFKKIKRV